MTAPPTGRPARFHGWDSVPPHLLTRTQLRDLDLPRTPAGPPRAAVRANNWRAKQEWFELFDLAEALPLTSPARAAALRSPAADARHTCEDCGARTDRECGVRHAHQRRLCEACAYVATLADLQAQARADRARAVSWACEVLAAPAVRFVHARPFAVPGRRGPAAVHITAAGSDGRTVLNLSVRFARRGAPGVPGEALSRTDAAPRLAEVLDGVLPVVWDTATTDLLRRLIPEPHRDRLSPAYGPGRWAEAARHVTSWRADVDPRILVLRPAVEPGSAGHLHLLLTRIAAAVPAEETAG